MRVLHKQPLLQAEELCKDIGAFAWKSVAKWRLFPWKNVTKQVLFGRKSVTLRLKKINLCYA